MAKDYLLFGRNILKEAVAVRAPISTIYFENDPSKLYAEQILGRSRVEFKRGIPKELLHQPHQGVAFVTTHQFYLDAWNVEQEQFPIVLFCNHIEDVQNLGAIARSAVAFGVGLIVHEERRSVHLNAAAVKVSAGQAFRLKFLEVSNITPWCRKLRDQGYSLVGLGMDENSQSLFKWEPQFPLAIFLGSESDGLSKPVTNQLDTLVNVRMAKDVESLNASQAATVAMAWAFENFQKFSK